VRRFVVALLAIGALVAYPAGAAVTDWHKHKMLATSRVKGYHTVPIPAGSTVEIVVRVNAHRLEHVSLNHGCRGLYNGQGVVLRTRVCGRGDVPIRVRYAAWHHDHEVLFKWRVA
jgi:hypothetical protein